MAEIETMTGVGCFGRPQTLSRVLGRVMQGYSMPNWEDRFEAAPSPSGAVALRHLMRPGGARAHECVSGFFLGLREGRLHLSVFTRGGTARRRYIARLARDDRAAATNRG